MDGRKLVALLLALLLPASASAGSVAMMMGGGGTSCATPNSGDELDEGFLGTGYENTWSEPAGTPNEDVSLPGSPPAASCTEGLQTDGNAAASVATWDRGVVFDRSGSMDVACDIYVATYTQASFDSSQIIHWDNDTVSGTVGVAALRLYWSGSVMQIEGRGTTTSARVTLAQDTWATVKLHMDGTAANSYVQCLVGCADTTTQATFTRVDTADGRYLHLGPQSGITAGEQADVIFGYCYAHTP